MKKVIVALLIVLVFSNCFTSIVSATEARQNIILVEEDLRPTLKIVGKLKNDSKMIKFTFDKKSITNKFLKCNTTVEIKKQCKYCKHIEYSYKNFYTKSLNETYQISYKFKKGEKVSKVNVSLFFANSNPQIKSMLIFKYSFTPQ